MARVTGVQSNRNKPEIPPVRYKLQVELTKGTSRHTIGFEAPHKGHRRGVQVTPQTGRPLGSIPEPKGKNSLARDSFGYDDTVVQTNKDMDL